MVVLNSKLDEAGRRADGRGAKGGVADAQNSKLGRQAIQIHKEDPIGQHFGTAYASHSGDYEIVGIVEDAKYQDTRGPAYPTFFLPLLQKPRRAAKVDPAVALRYE